MIEFYSSHQNLFATLFIFTFILSLITFVMMIVLVLRTKKLRATTTALFAGKKGSDLEGVIVHNTEKLRELDTEIQELFNISNAINNHAHKSIHKIGVVRFNPFGEQAGNQSFAAALLNSNNDGIILSSLHTREGTRIYTKQIIQGQPVNNELTQEEQAAITNAR